MTVASRDSLSCLRFLYTPSMSPTFTSSLLSRRTRKWSSYLKNRAKKSAQYTCIYTHTHTHTHTYIHANTHIHTYIPTYLSTYLLTYLPTYLPTCMHAYIHKNKHTHIHTLKSINVLQQKTTNFSLVCPVVVLLFLFFPAAGSRAFVNCFNFIFLKSSSVRICKKYAYTSTFWLEVKIVHGDKNYWRFELTDFTIDRQTDRQTDT